MTIAVDLGRKATKTNNNLPGFFGNLTVLRSAMKSQHFCELNRDGDYLDDVIVDSKPGLGLLKFYNFS